MLLGTTIPIKIAKNPDKHIIVTCTKLIVTKDDLDLLTRTIATFPNSFGDGHAPGTDYSMKLPSALIRGARTRIFGGSSGAIVTAAMLAYCEEGVRRACSTGIVGLGKSVTLNGKFSTAQQSSTP